MMMNINTPTLSMVTIALNVEEVLIPTNNSIVHSDTRAAAEGLNLVPANDISLSQVGSCPH